MDRTRLLHCREEGVGVGVGASLRRVACVRSTGGLPLARRQGLGGECAGATWRRRYEVPRGLGQGLCALGTAARMLGTSAETCPGTPASLLAVMLRLISAFSLPWKGSFPAE